MVSQKSDKDELVVKLAQNITDEISFPVKTDKELEAAMYSKHGVVCISEKNSSFKKCSL